jgi:hypothetical protein
MEHEVLAMPRGELGVAGDVGRARDLVLVPRDEHAVARRDEIGPDVVRPHADGELVRRDGVLGPVGAGAASVADDERGTAVLVVRSRLTSALGGDGHDEREQDEGDQRKQRLSLQTHCGPPVVGDGVRRRP